jgi:hypothetical protein
MIRDFFRNNYSKIHEINKKYAVPNVEMSKSVKIALLSLRFYLIFLVCLLVYKFITLL